MKKILSAAFALILVSTLCSCRESADLNTNDIKTDTTLADITESKDRAKAFFLEKANEVDITENSVIFSDASGEGRKEFPLRPVSTVCLSPSLTTLWYEAGGRADGCIGGSSAISLYLEAIGRDITADEGMTVAAASPSGKSFDIESIIAMKPSLIICSTSMNGYATVSSPAKAAGIPVIAADYDDFADYLKWFKVFCHLNGRPELWEEVAIPVLDEVSDVMASVPDSDTPKVFSMFSGGSSLKANTKNTFVGEMIALLGAENIADSGNTVGAERIEINLEAVFAADPDIILVQCHNDAEDARKMVEAAFSQNMIWKSLDAVKNGRVYYLDKSLFHNRPGSRFGEAYRTLYDMLYR